MKNNLVVLTLILSMGSSVFADSYMEKTMAFSNVPTKVWTKGAKQRTEMTIPLFGMGTTITILRADKGLQWTINTKDQTYFESAMASPRTTSTQNIPNFDALAQPNSNCQQKIEKMPPKKTIGGIRATGFREWCEQSPDQKRIYWFAPTTGTPAKVLKDQLNFSKAQLQAQYGALSREMNQKASAFINRLQNPLHGKVPQGLLLSIETETGEKTTTNYEITKISTEKLDDALFEIPAGYQKSDPFKALLEKKQPITK